MGLLKRRLFAATPRMVVCVMALGLAACSGGGGGGSTAPQPTAPAPAPAPTNAAPVIVIDLDTAAPDEGQPFVIDASGSTDADGDPLIITVTQVSGLEAGAAPPLAAPLPTGALAFSAPEVSGDEAMVFEVTVSDGETSTVRTVEVTAANIVLEPVTSDWLISQRLSTQVTSPSGTLAFPIDNIANAGDSVFTFGRTDGDVPAIEFYEWRSDGSLGQSQLLPLPDVIDRGPVSSFGADLWSDVLLDVVFVFRESGVLKVFGPTTTFPAAISERTTLDVPGICAADAYYSEDRSAGVSGTSVQDIALLTEAGDMSVAVNLDLGASAEPSAPFEELRSTASGLSGCQMHATNQYPESNLIVLDPDAKTISYVPEPGNATGEGIITANIEFEDGADLDIIGFASTSAGNIGIIASDGKHVGDHRFLHYAFARDRSAALEEQMFNKRSEVRWPKGRPTDIAIAFGGPLRMIISSDTVPYTLEVALNDGLLSSLSYIPTGLGATEVINSLSFRSRVGSVFLTQPESRQILQLDRVE